RIELWNARAGPRRARLLHGNSNGLYEVRVEGSGVQSRVACKLRAMKSKCFNYISSPDARLLILGSLPGRMSLEQQKYYAQPLNAFWRIMGELADARPELPYEERLEQLRRNRIAVWDVCAIGFRPGSLDSDIDLSTVRANDIAAFLQTHPNVELICFNGRKAQEIFLRKVRQEPRDLFARVRYMVLP